MFQVFDTESGLTDPKQMTKKAVNIAVGIRNKKAGWDRFTAVRVDEAPEQTTEAVEITDAQTTGASADLNSPEIRKIMAEALLERADKLNAQADELRRVAQTYWKE